MNRLVYSITGLVAVTLAVTAMGAEDFPEGAKGFAGMLSGKVVSKAKDEIVVQVTKIENSWEQSKAQFPESMIDAKVTIRLNPDLYKKKEGYLAKVQKFFETLKVADVEKFDVKNAEGNVFIFGELTKQQKERVEEKVEAKSEPKAPAKPKDSPAPKTK